MNPESHRPRCWLLVASLFFTAFPIIGAAQSAAIVGIVTTRDSVPVEAMVLKLYPLDREVRTSTNGTFGFDGLPAGVFGLIARRVGFAPETLSVVLGDDEVRAVTFRLRSAVLIETVVINARRAELPRVVDRQERRLGRVLFADEIMRIGAYSVADLLLFTRLSAAGASVVFVDGRANGRINELRPSDIAAIEVQKGLVGLREPDLWLPPWLKFDSSAPIVLIWTHAYVQEQAKRREAAKNRQPPP